MIFSCKKVIFYSLFGFIPSLAGIKEIKNHRFPK